MKNDFLKLNDLFFTFSFRKTERQKSYLLGYGAYWKRENVKLKKWMEKPLEPQIADAHYRLLAH